MSKEMKPCPFCGSEEDNWEYHPSNCYLYIIQDQFESFEMKPVMDLKCTEDVHDAWNARRLDTELVEALEDADEVICTLCKRLNPQHKNCTSCGDREGMLKIITKYKGKVT